MDKYEIATKIHSQLFDRTKYIWTEDRKVYGVLEDWRIPVPGPDGIVRDDCDGATCLIGSKLVETNLWTWDQMFPAVCKVNQANNDKNLFDHCVLAFEIDDSIWISDVRHKGIWKKSQFNYSNWYRPEPGKSILDPWIKWND